MIRSKSYRPNSVDPDANGNRKTSSMSYSKKKTQIKKGNKEKNRAFHNKIEIRDKMESTVCKNESCRLGCICESIQGTGNKKTRNLWGVLRIKPDHCNEIVCMFDCVCHLPNEKAKRKKTNTA